MVAAAVFMVNLQMRTRLFARTPVLVLRSAEIAAKKTAEPVSYRERRPAGSAVLIAPPSSSWTWTWT
jgi:hypothetical protein